MVKVAALVEAERIELLDLPGPAIGEDDGLLTVEGCGICGSDVDQFRATKDRERLYPIVPGHEVVGRIAEIGPIAARRWGVEVGSRVAIEPPLPCGSCRGCRGGAKISTCVDPSLGAVRAYSQIPVAVEPGLWGGYAEQMYLHPLTTLHPMPDDIPIERALLFNPLANGIEWAVFTPGLRMGDSVLVLGPGQRGLACVVAAREAGAGRIVVTGLEADAHKLDLAVELGADATVTVGRGDDLAALRAATEGAPVDVVVDATPRATEPVVHAVDVVRPGGTVVLAGLKDMRPVGDLVTDRIVLKEIVVRGVRSASSRAFQEAIAIVARGRPGLERLPTHAFGLDEAERAVRTLAGESGEPAIAVCIRN